MSPSPESPDFDLDEDLFDFASVERERGPEPSVEEEDLDRVFASLRDSIEEEELLAFSAPAPVAPVEPPAPPSSDRLPASLAPRPSETTAPAARAPRPEAAPAPVLPSASAPTTHVPAAPEPRVEPSVEPEPALPTATHRAPRAATSTRSLVAIALAVTVLNSAVAVTLLRGRGAAPHAEREEAHAAEAAQSQAAREHAPEPALPDPGKVVPSTHPALEAARAEIARGEYASARQRVYGLLAIIDRLEEPRRSALEADCQYLVAQTLHLEALARMGGGR